MSKCAWFRKKAPAAAAIAKAPNQKSGSNQTLPQLPPPLPVPECTSESPDGDTRLDWTGLMSHANEIIALQHLHFLSLSLAKSFLKGLFKFAANGKLIQFRSIKT